MDHFSLYLMRTKWYFRVERKTGRETRRGEEGKKRRREEGKKQGGEEEKKRGRW